MPFWSKAAPTPGEIKYWVHSESGYNHANEDAVEIRPHPDDATAFVCVLADGQGGQAGGAPAAQRAVAAAMEAALAAPVKALLRPDIWVQIGEEADAAVTKNPEAGYCTLVALLVTPEAVCGVSCGDSAAILYTPKENLLSQRQLKTPPVGSGGAPFIPFEAKLTIGAKILLVSDGVWKYADWETMAKHASMTVGADLIGVLRAEVLERNRVLPDDFSVAALQIVAS